MCQICNYNENIATLPCDRCSKRLGPNGWHHASGGFRFHDDCKSASGEAAPQEGEWNTHDEECRARVYTANEELAKQVRELRAEIRTLSEGKAAAEARAEFAERIGRDQATAITDRAEASESRCAALERALGHVVDCHDSMGDCSAIGRSTADCKYVANALAFSPPRASLSSAEIAKPEMPGDSDAE